LRLSLLGESLISRTGLTGPTGLIAPTNLRKQKSIWRLCLFMGVSHLFTFSPFHL